MTYTVKRGDSLAKIAAAHNLSLDQLLDANPRFKAKPDQIRIGDTVTIPEPPKPQPPQPEPQIEPSTYTVKAGDSLAKIAAVHNLTLDQLLEANPRYQARPDQIRIGDTVIIPQDSPAEPPATLGRLSEKYESSGRGPGTVSGGGGDPGGVSYGCYQFTSKKDCTVKAFVSQDDFPWRAMFADLVPGTPNFSQAWKEIARRFPEEFRDVQHAYVKKNYFDKLAAKVKMDSGLDVARRSRALQDAIWSTAVQHGPNTTVVAKALRTLEQDGTLNTSDPDFDRKLIKAIYAERGRKNRDGVLLYFKSSSLAVQKGIAKRYADEEKDALKMLDN